MARCFMFYKRISENNDIIGVGLCEVIQEENMKISVP